MERYEMHKNKGLFATLLWVLLPTLSSTLSSASAQSDTQRRLCPDVDEKATAAEQALCWFQLYSSGSQQCATVKDPVNECISQATLWCVDASLDTDPVTNACFLSAMRAGQLNEANEIAQYFRTPTKIASTCIAALKKATIRIVSNPSGAEVIVDGRSYGAAPVVVNLTGNWWESRVKVKFGTDSGFNQIEVSSEELMRAIDREVCVFGDLVIEESAKQAEPPIEAEPVPALQPGEPQQTEPPTTAEEEQSLREEDLSDSEPAVHEEKSNLLPYIFVGAGGVLLAGGLVTGIMYLSAKGELKDNCDRSTQICYVEESTLDRAKTLALTTDILLITGVAALGTGVVLMFLESGEDAPIDNSTALASTAPAASLGCSADACFGSVTFGF